MITAVTEQHIAVIFSTLTDLASRRYYSHHILDKKVSLFLCLFHKIVKIKYISGLKIFFLQIKSDKIWSCKTQNSNWRVKSKPELVFEKKKNTWNPKTNNQKLKSFGSYFNPDESPPLPAFYWEKEPALGSPCPSSWAWKWPWLRSSSRDLTLCHVLWN